MVSVAHNEDDIKIIGSRIATSTVLNLLAMSTLFPPKDNIWNYRPLFIIYTYNNRLCTVAKRNVLHSHNKSDDTSCNLSVFFTCKAIKKNTLKKEIAVSSSFSGSFPL